MSQIKSEDIAVLEQSGHFDAAWYARTYPDVALTGFGPAEHYLRLGYRMNRDPGPKFSNLFNRLAHLGLQEWQEPVTALARLARAGKAARPDRRRVLHAAWQLAEWGDHTRAIALASRHLDPAHAHTVAILQANAALADGHEAGWLAGLNAYLAHFGAAPVALAAPPPLGGPLFDRLTTAPLPPVTGGPLVSVIMPAWNAAASLRTAVASVLRQTWTNLELLVVDDASTDGTWGLLQELAAQDSRLRIHRNAVNVGPYVSKNIALQGAQGAWITGHDADDWAHPQRLEQHLALVLAEPEPVQASLTHMIRLRPDGHFDTFAPISTFTPDGVTRVSSISTLFDRGLLVDQLGAWDSVRFGADSELIGRARCVLGAGFVHYDRIGMLCLSTETGLTNHPEHGVRTATGLSQVRTRYKAAWTAWHEKLPRSAVRLDPVQTARAFAAPPEMIVPPADVQAAQGTVPFAAPPG
jgi:hypothetical protein